MTTDTFCSTYPPKGPPTNSACSNWSLPVRAHVLHVKPFTQLENISTLGGCEKQCCKNISCQSVLYNTQARFCQFFSVPYNSPSAGFRCLNNTGDEWVSNKALAGATPEECGGGGGPWTPPSSASQCRDDMTVIMQSAARRQLVRATARVACFVVQAYRVWAACYQCAGGGRLGFVSVC
jgi:hypothetical protein